MRNALRSSSLRSGLALALWASLAAGRPARGCDNLDDPFQVLDLYLEMDPADWEIVRHDISFDLERPAFFRCGDEELLPVMVRRKISDARPSSDDPQKVSLKIDFDDQLPGLEWHGQRKLSLESGETLPERLHPRLGLLIARVFAQWRHRWRICFSRDDACPHPVSSSGLLRAIPRR